MTTRSEGLLNKYNSIIPKIKKFQDNMKKIQKNNTDDKIPELTIGLLKTKLIMSRKISKNLRWGTNC